MLGSEYYDNFHCFRIITQLNSDQSDFIQIFSTSSCKILWNIKCMDDVTPKITKYHHLTVVPVVFHLVYGSHQNNQNFHPYTNWLQRSFYVKFSHFITKIFLACLNKYISTYVFFSLYLYLLDYFQLFISSFQSRRNLLTDYLSRKKSIGFF